MFLACSSHQYQHHRLLHPEWTYLDGHGPFAELGSDVILTVSSKIVVFIADADVITQVTTRRNDFPKPLAMYKRLDIYGKSLITSEGAAWRIHRKLTGPSFSEKNNGLVFYESIHHAQSMLTLWTGPDHSGNRTIKRPDMDIMRMTLYIISRAGFDVRILWPHEESAKTEACHQESEEGIKAQFGANPGPGHSMSYREAISTLLENIVWTQVLPPHILSRTPIKIFREVGNAVVEWGKYMDELYDAKAREVASGHSGQGMDLFGALIRGSGILNEDSDSSFKLQKSDLLGNAFVMMIAGHETTANALHFSLLLLAMNWGSQKHLQEDLDKALQGKPIEEWTYEEEIPHLWNGMVAAVINEALRLYQPIINIPKTTPMQSPQAIAVGGRECIIPGGAHLFLSASVHRNPKYWPCAVDDNGQSDPKDLDQFRPERWLLDGNHTIATPIEKPQPSHEEDHDPFEELHTSTHLFRPVGGSFIPFSYGYRSCVGRKFAQVELLAALAVIFREFSVELAVDAFATDAEIEAMPKGGKERREVWQKAADKANYLLTRTMTSMITLQMREEHVPLRLVRRGEERFVFDG